MTAAVLKFPSYSGEGKAPQSKPVTFSTFDASRAAELLIAARSAVSSAELLLAFVHNNRSIAQQAGIESVVIEISAIMEGERFSGVIDAIEEAGANKESLDLSHGGLSTLRRIEALIAEASMNMRKFTEEDFTPLEIPSKAQVVAPLGSSSVANIEQPKSSDLSILIPFAILGAIVATAAVVAVVVREK